MVAKGVNLEVAAVALDRADGRAFEKFAQALFVAILGVEFVPLGGTGDGGADAFVEVFEAKSSHFIQITREPEHKAKIRHTVQRLRQVGRTPKRLTYITALTVSRLDQEQKGNPGRRTWARHHYPGPDLGGNWPLGLQFNSSRRFLGGGRG